MELIGEIFTFIIIIIVVFGIIFLILGSAEKFFGISYTTKGNLSKAREINKSYANVSKYTLDKLRKENPKLYHRACENVKRKHYSLTYNNVNREIDKIKKREPDWVEEEREKQLAVNKKLDKLKSEALIQKHGVADVLEKMKELKNFNNDDYKKYSGIAIKLNMRKKLTESESKISETNEFKSFKIKYDDYDKLSNNKKADLMNYFAEFTANLYQ